MGLSDHDRRAYERQLLLAELGERGQRRLLEARVAVRSDAPSAIATAQQYLQRAGARIVAAPGDGRRWVDREDIPPADATRLADAGDARAIARWAGTPRLEEAAACLAGSLAAVEAVKAIVGAGTPAPLPGGWTLGPEDP